jgi:NhaP-type Na+/H+ or K+/H+ antiporter
MLTASAAGPPPTQTQAGQWLSLLLAIACTLVVAALFAAPLWLPYWGRWRAVAGSHRSDARLGSQRFADAVARGDFDQQAETETAHLLDRG